MEWRSFDLFAPTPDHAQLAVTLREFVTREVEPQAAEHDREERFNHALFRRAGEHGLLGVTIGEDSLLASGTMIIDNMEIPTRSLVVGVPGRLRGQIEERHLELIKYYGGLYIEKTKRYKRQGDLESPIDR